MFTKPISNDASKLLRALYKEYLKRRKNKISKDGAMAFSSEEVKIQLFSKWIPDDFDNALYELYKAKLVRMDITGNFQLLNEAIVYMENLPKKNASDIIDTATKFIP